MERHDKFSDHRASEERKKVIEKLKRELTVALAEGKLDPASAGKGHRQGLVDPEGRGRGRAAADDGTDALRLRLHYGGELRAAGARRGGGVAGDVVQARRQASDGRRAGRRLGLSAGRQHRRHCCDHKDCMHGSLCGHSGSG